MEPRSPITGFPRQPGSHILSLVLNIIPYLPCLSICALEYTVAEPIGQNGQALVVRDFITTWAWTRFSLGKCSIRACWGWYIP